MSGPIQPHPLEAGFAHLYKIENMKNNLVFRLMLCLTPVWAPAQVMDTAAVVRQVDSLIQVSRTLADRRVFDKALEINALAEKIVLEKLGRETATYGAVCSTYGRVFDSKLEYAEAEKWYMESKTIQEKILGKESPEYARLLDNLAILYANMGHPDKAEVSFLEAKTIREKVLGKENPDYAKSLNNLALLYRIMGLYEKSEPFFLESKSVREKTIGKKHPDYAPWIE